MSILSESFVTFIPPVLLKTRQFSSLRSSFLQICKAPCLCHTRQTTRATLNNSKNGGTNDEDNDSTESQGKELVISYDNMYDVMRDMGLEVDPNAVIDRRMRKRKYVMPKDELRRRYRRLVGMREEGVDGELIDDDSERKLYNDEGLVGGSMVAKEEKNERKGKARKRQRTGKGGGNGGDTNGENRIGSCGENKELEMEANDKMEEQKNKPKRKTRKRQRTSRGGGRDSGRNGEDKNGTFGESEELKMEEKSKMEENIAGEQKGVVKSAKNGTEDMNVELAESSLRAERNSVTIIRNALQKTGRGMQYRVAEEEAPNPDLDYDIEEEGLRMLQGISNRVMAHDIHAKYRERLASKGTLFDDMKENEEGLFPKPELKPADEFTEKVLVNLERAIAEMGSHSRESGSYANLKPFKGKYKKIRTENGKATFEKDTGNRDGSRDAGADEDESDDEPQQPSRKEQGSAVRWELFDEDAFIEKNKEQIEESEDGTLIVRKKKRSRAQKAKPKQHDVEKAVEKAVSLPPGKRKRGRPRRGESLDDTEPLGDPDYSKRPTMPPIGPYRRVTKPKVGQTTDFINTTNYRISRKLKGSKKVEK